MCVGRCHCDRQLHPGVKRVDVNMASANLCHGRGNHAWSVNDGSGHLYFFETTDIPSLVAGAGAFPLEEIKMFSVVG